MTVPGARSRPDGFSDWDESPLSLTLSAVSRTAHEHVQVLIPVDVKLSTDKAGAVILQVLKCCLDGCHQYCHPSLFVAVSNSRSVAPVG
jgi:hypothetical protein